MNLRSRLYLLALPVLFVGMGILHSQPAAVRAASAAKERIEAVEPDMHEFMEYYFEPSFKRLKAAMADAPTSNAGWKPIKAEGMLMAEGGNLLLVRLPEDDASDWAKHSTAVREDGGNLYRAAKAKDYSQARQHYESMVKNCNACHHQFAGGEHILEP